MSPAVRQLVAALTRRQHGLVAVGQLRQGGLAPAEVRSVARALLEVRRGVLAMPGVPVHPARDVLAACLAAGEGAVASHWAAGALLGLKGVAPGTLELSVPGQSRLAGVAVHRLRQPLDILDRSRCQGVPVTSVARTMVDLASTRRLWLVERALDDALIRGLCRLSDVTSAVERSHGRRGVTEMEALLAARCHDRFDSHQELRWVRLIRRHLGLDPVLHHRVGVFEIDIAFPPEKVGFEVNGWEAHGTRSAFDHDANKGNELLLAGWHVGTLTSNMADRDVIHAVRGLLAIYGNRVCS